MKLIDVIRWIITGAIIWFLFKRADWLVALCLTSILIAQECNILIIRYHRIALEKILLIQEMILKNTPIHSSTLTKEK